jgi:hypothetical protein
MANNVQDFARGRKQCADHGKLHLTLCFARTPEAGSLIPHPFCCNDASDDASGHSKSARCMICIARRILDPRMVGDEETGAVIQ